MARRIVCLTFDFDAVSGWISRGLTSPTPMSRGEFGLVGARRILALLAEYDIRATWFIPGHTIESFSEPMAMDTSRTKEQWLPGKVRIITSP